MIKNKFKYTIRKQILCYSQSFRYTCRDVCWHICHVYTLWYRLVSRVWGERDVSTYHQWWEIFLKPARTLFSLNFCRTRRSSWSKCTSQSSRKSTSFSAADSESRIRSPLFVGLVCLLGVSSAGLLHQEVKRCLGYHMLEFVLCK